MSELRQIGTQLDERTTNLLSGLEDADHRFKAVARNADKADAARVVIEALMATVQQAERRMAELGEGVDSAVERSEALTVLSKRADRVMADIRQREHALSKAAEQLEGVSTLRQEAAEVVQSLEDQIRGIEGGSPHRRGAVREDRAAGGRAGKLGPAAYALPKSGSRNSRRSSRASTRWSRSSNSRLRSCSPDKMASVRSGATWRSCLLPRRKRWRM